MLICVANNMLQIITFAVCSKTMFRFLDKKLLDHTIATTQWTTMI